MKNPKIFAFLASSGFFIFLISINSICFSQTVKKEASIEKCLIVSDIHFDPLFGAHQDTALYEKLQSATIEDWKKLFENNILQTTVNAGLLGKDSNYGILQSALANMRKKLARPAFIIIAGDFIWHGAKPVDSLLKKKSIRFIAQLFKYYFPGATIIPALGNNDTYGADYALQDNRFLNDFADAWSPNLPKKAAKQLKTGGYYTLIKDNINFMVINSATVGYGSQYQEQADTMLNWVQKKLSGNHVKNVWFIMHIPPGLNGYNDKNMWNVDNAQTFVNSVVKYSAKVKFSIASHTHFDDFKVFYNTDNRPVAFLRIVPSICDNHGNNPSFEVAEFNKNTGKIIRETNYYLDLASISSDKNAGPLDWNKKLCLPESLQIKRIGAQGFSDFINKAKNDFTGEALKQYVKFYTVGTNIDSSKTINHGNMLNYLKADSLKAQ